MVVICFCRVRPAPPHKVTSDYVDVTCGTAPQAVLLHNVVDLDIGENRRVCAWCCPRAVVAFDAPLVRCVDRETTLYMFQSLMHMYYIQRCMLYIHLISPSHHRVPPPTTSTHFADVAATYFRYWGAGQGLLLLNSTSANRIIVALRSSSSIVPLHKFQQPVPGDALDGEGGDEEAFSQVPMQVSRRGDGELGALDELIAFPPLPPSAVFLNFLCRCLWCRSFRWANACAAGSGAHDETPAAVFKNRWRGVYVVGCGGWSLFARIDAE